MRSTHGATSSQVWRGTASRYASTVVTSARPQLRAKAQHARKLADRAYGVSADDLVDRLREVANELEAEADALERQQDAG